MRAESGDDRLLRDLSRCRTVLEAAGTVCDHLVAAGLPMPSVYIEVAGRLRCIAQRGYWQIHDGVPPEIGILGSTFRSGVPSIVADVRSDPDFIAAGQDVIGEVTFPFRHQGRVVGCLNMEAPHAMAEEDVALIASTSAALEARITELGGLPEETPWQLLARESAALTRLHDHDAITRFAVERASAIIAMSSAILVLVEDEDSPHVAACHGPLTPVLRSMEHETLLALCDWTGGGASVYTFGSFPTSGFIGSSQKWDNDVQALVTVAVMGATGFRGFLLAADGQPTQPTTEDVQALELFATHLASALQIADVLAELRHQASCDTLTGLGHGAAFRGRLTEEMTSSGDGLGVLIIDLDEFKALNDTEGHQAGDRALVEVARAIEEVLRSPDRVYRIGGDEFAALITADTEREAVTVAERLRQAVAATGHLTASIGVRWCAWGADDTTPDQLVADADLAMYRSKAQGRDRVEVYRPAMRDAEFKRAQLVADVGHAIQSGALRLDYQPIIDLGSEVVLGAEARVRWCHPIRGVIPGAGVLEAAQESGDVIAVATWMLRTAAAQAVAWRRETGLPIWVSLDVPGALLRPGFADLVGDALGDTGLPAGALMVEVTESELVHGERLDVLSALRDLGVRVAVDDFGTGFSPLSYFRHLPIDALKIDRSFLTDLEDDRSTVLAGMIIDFAKTFGLTCIAAGIETAAQADRIRELGCPQGQGSWVCPPSPPERVLAMARSPGAA